MFLLQGIVKQAVLCAEQIGLTCVCAADKGGSFDSSLLSALSTFVVSKCISVGSTVVLFLYPCRHYPPYCALLICFTM